jgi:hypothetical protein
MTPPDRPVPGDTEHARRAAVSRVQRRGRQNDSTQPSVVQIFDDITVGSRAESRRRRGMRDEELNERQAPALVHGGDATPIVDAEVIEPEPDGTEDTVRSNAERPSRTGRRDIYAQ